MSNKGGLRIPFPDYDYADEKGKIPVYVEKANDCWGAYVPIPECSVTFNADKGVKLDKFVERVTSFLEKSGVDYVLRCQLREDAISKVTTNQVIIERIKNGRCKA